MFTENHMSGYDAALKELNELRKEKENLLEQGCRQFELIEINHRIKDTAQTPRRTTLPTSARCWASTGMRAN